MEELKYLKTKIEKIKDAFGYTNKELGEICDVSYTAIANIINGVTKDPSVSIFINLSQKLDINIDWLLFNKGEMFKNPLKAKDNDEQQTIFYKQKYENQKIIEVLLSGQEVLWKYIRYSERLEKNKNSNIIPF